MIPILDQQVKSWPFKYHTSDGFCSNQLRASLIWIEGDFSQITDARCIWNWYMAGCNGYFCPYGKYFSTKNLDFSTSNFGYQQVQMKFAWQIFSRKLWVTQLLMQLWTSFKAHNFAWKIILMRFLTNETLSHHQSPGFFKSKMFFRPKANNQKIHMIKI